MNARLLAAVIRTPPPADGADADLLRRFLAGKDDAAFAELVRRYSRLVWSVCRNSLGHEADAEDAFQAVFVALARNAKQVREGRAVGGWLHGVAVRVCMKLKRGEARRTVRQQAAAAGEAAQPVADSRWDAALAAVHAEVAALPDIYRLPFVLCCLEGRGATEAAEHLGWKLGTLSGRLTRAKQLVLDRLAARGFAPAVAGLAVAVAAAEAPASLVQSAAGLAGGTVPTTVLTLARGATEVAVAKKLLAAAVLVTGMGVGWYATADAQSAPVTRPAATPAAGPARGGDGGDGAAAQGVPGAPARGAGGRTGGVMQMSADGPKTSDAWTYKFATLQTSSDAKQDPLGYSKEFKDTIVKHGNVGWEYVGLVPGSNELIFKRQNRGPGGMASGGFGGFGFGTGGPGTLPATGAVGMPSGAAPVGGPPPGSVLGAGGAFGGGGRSGGATAPAGGGRGGSIGGSFDGGGFGVIPGRTPATAANDSDELRIVDLKHSDTVDTSTTLGRLFPNLLIVPEPNTNRMILKGDKKEIKDAADVIDKLDVASAKPDPKGGGATPKKK